MSEYGPNLSHYECLDCGAKWWDGTIRSGNDPKKCHKCGRKNIRLDPDRAGGDSAPQEGT